jgi:ABC-2 type transport system permease protein
MGAIFRREMKAYFTSPAAYIFIAVFYFYTALYFVNYNIYYAVSNLSFVFTSAFVIMMVMLPILTMRLFAEERRQKTDQCLLTAPVGLFSIVFAKFAAALCVFLCAVSVFAFYLLSLSAMGANIAWSVVIGSLVALLLLGGCFISIGLFVSSLTENQIVSAIISIILGILFYMLDMIAGTLDSIFVNTNVETVKNAISSLALYTRYAEFSTGILNFESVFFFLSFIFVFNFLTVRALEKRRWG